eukprot:9466468-Pyramimonas_sp.AAC.2
MQALIGQIRGMPGLASKIGALKWTGRGCETGAGALCSGLTLSASGSCAWRGDPRASGWISRRISKTWGGVPAKMHPDFDPCPSLLHVYPAFRIWQASHGGGAAPHQEDHQEEEGHREVWPPARRQEQRCPEPGLHSRWRVAGQTSDAFSFIFHPPHPPHPPPLLFLIALALVPLIILFSASSLLPHPPPKGALETCAALGRIWIAHLFYSSIPIGSQAVHIGPLIPHHPRSR